MRRLIGFFAVTAIAASCASVPATPPDREPTLPDPGPTTVPPPLPLDPQQATGLVLEVSPPSTQILVNDTVVGSVEELSATGGLLELEPGLYRIVLSHPEYETWRGEISVGEQPETLRVALSPRK